jgi:hypothetical protein
VEPESAVLGAEHICLLKSYSLWFLRKEKSAVEEETYQRSYNFQSTENVPVTFHDSVER